MQATTPTDTTTVPPQSEQLPATIQPEARGRATLEIIKALAGQPDQKEMLQQLIDAETARDLFDQDYRSARIYAMSGQFDDINGKTVEQSIATAMSKIRIGREWSMNESDAIAFIFFTNGRPAVMTEIMAAMIQRRGYNWDAEFHWADETYKGRPSKRCVGCTLWLKQYNSFKKVFESVVDRKGEQVSASFMEADADRALIWEKGKQIPLSEKWNFKAWTQDMYFWRAMSRLRKYHLTSIMRGAIQYELRHDIEIEPMAPQLPAPELQPSGQSEVAPEPKPRKLRDRILQPEQQESLLDPKPVREPGEGE